MKDTCATWGLYQLTCGAGVAWQGRPCICLHLIIFYWTKVWTVFSSSAEAMLLVKWENYSPENFWTGLIIPHRMERLCAHSTTPANGFNPDKLIGSRRGEGTLCVPPPLHPYPKRGLGGWGCPPKNTAADTIIVIAINQNYLAMRCTSEGVRLDGYWLTC